MENDSSYLYLENLHRLIQEKPDVSQRDVSRALQMSLGMTNSLLKRFAEKGWIYMQKVNAKNIRYALTPAGMNELAERSYRYVKRTMKSVVQYRDILVKAVSDAREHGCEAVIIAGETDFLFLIEHACEKNKLQFEQIKKNGVLPKKLAEKKLLILFAEPEEYKKNAIHPNTPEKSVCMDISRLFY